MFFNSLLNVYYLSLNRQPHDYERDALTTGLCSTWYQMDYAVLGIKCLNFDTFFISWDLQIYKKLK